MTVFLNDSIAIAGRPKIVVIVDGAAVGDIRNDLQSPKLFTTLPSGSNSM